MHGGMNITYKQNRISGSLAIIKYHQSNFLIGKLEDETTIKGNMLSPQIGMCYIFNGQWENHPRFGRQFAFTDYTTSYPTSLSAIRNYLRENCKWIGPEISKRLVNAYGKETLKICKEQPERVAKEISGLNLQRAQEITTVLRNNEANENLQLALKEILDGTRINQQAANLIIEKWGQDAPAVIRENPYILIDAINGIGFLTADNVARKIGYDSTSPLRLRAGVLHTLKEHTFRSGHTCLPKKVLLIEAERILEVQPKQIIKVVEQLLKDGFIVATDNLVYLSIYYDDEIFISKRLKELMSHTKERDDFTR